MFMVTVVTPTFRNIVNSSSVSLKFFLYKGPLQMWRRYMYFDEPITRSASLFVRSVTIEQNSLHRAI